MKETSSTSSCDGDSVIYMGHRNTFKGVDELVVTAEESLCLQAAESAKSLELPVPQHASSYISFSPSKLQRIPNEPFVVDTQIAPRCLYIKKFLFKIMNCKICCKLIW